jgi:phosphoenolpyruvate carboxykinase (GTP)
LPKIFHVNWFRKDQNGKFLWPGFGENSRVLDWISSRIEGVDCYEKTPIGLVPSDGSLCLKTLETDINMKELFSIPKDFWLKEVEEIQTYFDNQVGADLPSEIQEQLTNLKERIEKM